MTEDTTALAGASESMSMSAAAGLLADFDEPETQEPAQASTESQADSSENEAQDPSAEDTSSQEPDEASEEASLEGDDPPKEGESEPDPEAEKYVHGNARAILRDGTVTTVGELKKLAEEAKEFRARAPELTAARQEIEAKRVHIAQQEQFFAQVLPLAMQIVQQQIPPAPSRDLMQSDPIAHYEQMSAHNEARQRLYQLQQAQAAHQQQAQVEAQHRNREQEAGQQSYLAEQRELLLSKIPEFKTPERRAEFGQEFLATAAKFGFTEDEANKVTDHRLILMIKGQNDEIRALKAKADAHDKLIAQRPAAEKKAAGAATPPKTPGQRVTPGQADVQRQQERFQRLRANGGRIADAAAILAEL